MPEMKLTRSQIRRLLSLPTDACEVALAMLVHSGFLVQTDDGRFLRAGGSLRRPSPSVSSALA